MGPTARKVWIGLQPYWGIFIFRSMVCCKSQPASTNLGKAYTAQLSVNSLCKPWHFNCKMRLVIQSLIMIQLVINFD